jgi:hypothetical protein
MAKKVEIELDVKGNIVESTKNLRALKTELKNVAAGTAEWNKIKNDIRDVEDALESAGQSSEDFKGLLENAPGPLGMLGGAIKKVELATKSWGAALKATGIGLLVSLIGGLVAAFSQTEGSLKKLEPLLIGMEKIFGGIVEIAMPLVDMFLDLALKALPYVTKGIGMVYSAFAGLFTYFKEVGTGVAKFWKGVFTLDYKSIEEGVKQIGGSFGKVADSYTDSMKRFEEGTKKQTKTQKENAAKQKENAAKQKEIDDKALQDKLKRMEAEDKIDEATLEKMKAEAMALATTEQQKLDIEEKFAKKSYEQRKKNLLEKQAQYKKDTDEYKSYTADLIKLDAEYTSTKTANDEKQKQLDITKRKEFFEKDKSIYQSQVDERQRTQATADEKELQALDIKLKMGQIKEYQYQQELYILKQRQLVNKMDQLKKEEQDEKDHYNKLYSDNKINKEDYENKLIELTKVYGDKRIETLKAQGENEFTNAVNLANQLVATKEYEKNAIIALEEAKINAVATLGNILTQLAGQNKTIAILGLAVSQGAAIADILTKFFRTKAGLIADKALYAAMIPNPFTAAIGIAGVAATTAGLTANTIGMAAGLAGVATAVAQGVAAINGKGGGTGNATNGQSGPAGNSAQALGRNYGDGGMINGPLHAQGGVMINAEGGEAVMTRGAVTMFGPLLSALNQAGGGTSFSQAAMGGSRFDSPNVSAPAQQASPMIMKTYVVENELTTAQHKQARLKDLSTL